MTKTQKILGRSTKVYQNQEMTIIRYHETDIVSFNDNEIILNSGNWLTSSTKKKMNQAAHLFELDFAVYQHKSKWYVNFKDQTYDFYDGMILFRV
jgi:hypothetical protein